MKLAFSTLGCPDWSWPDIYATAKDLGLQGIEIRGIANEMYAPKIKAFSEQHIGDTVAKLKSLRMEIPMLTSGAVISDSAGRDAAVAEIKEYIDLAQKLGTMYVRVLVAPCAELCTADLAMAAQVYAEVCAYGKDRGVTPLVETNGPFCDTKLCYDFVRDVENGGVLWDIHHPFRYGGESAFESYTNLGDRIRYIHIKDSMQQGNKTVYRMLGYGDVPVYDSVKLLKSGGYDGYISLEWVKRWNRDLEDAGIVFSHFASFMNTLLSEI